MGPIKPLEIYNPVLDEPLNNRALCFILQLVLVTAIEDKVLVGAEGFAYVLPLAATGTC